MTRLISGSGWLAVSLFVLGGLWLGDRAIEAPLVSTPPKVTIQKRAPIVIGDADRGRIRYPTGQYPQLGLSTGPGHPVHSLLDVSRPLAFGDYVWDTDGVSPGPVWVRIDLGRQMVSVFRSGDEIGTAVIIYGATGKPTPTGVFHILEKSQYYYSKSYDAPMPYALRLTTDGVALHGSTVRDRSATHGCIGLPTEFARLLYDAAHRGDEVEILPVNT